MKQSLMLLAVFLMVFPITMVTAQGPELYVFIGSYGYSQFTGQDILIPVSVQLIGATGEVEIEITPVPGLSCNDCTQVHNFTVDGEIYDAEFILRAERDGMFTVPFSVTARYLGSSGIEETEIAQQYIVVVDPSIDISLGYYPPFLLTGEELTIDYSISIQGAVGTVTTTLEPLPGFTCIDCQGVYTFTQGGAGEVFSDTFTIRADRDGFYQSPFTISSWLVQNPLITEELDAPREITVRNPSCSIDVFGLEVIDNVVSVNVKNTGEQDQEITNIVSIAGSEARTDTFTLTPGEIKEIVFTYSFGAGNYAIESVATSACGGYDSETISHYILAPYTCQGPPGVEGQNRCDFEKHQFLVCSANGWVVLGENDAEYCNNCAFGTCGDGILNCGETPETCPPDAPDDNGDCDDCDKDGDCGVAIASIESNYFLIGDDETHFVEVRVKNTGDEEEVIDLEIFLDGDDEEEESFTLAPGEMRTEYFYFEDLKEGEHVVQAEVEADCGSQDSYFVIFYVDDHRPDFDPECGIEIEGFDFTTQFNQNQRGFVEFDVRNIGNFGSRITVNLIIDGLTVGSVNEFIDEDEVFTDHFYYNKGPGAYILLLEASSACGAKETITGGVTVNPVVVPDPFPPVPPEEPGPPTSITIRPETFDVEVYTSKIIMVEIYSAEDHEFIIEVTGLPAEWIEYEPNFFVQRGSENRFIYFNPQEFGHYSATVTVRALEEDITLEKELTIYVSVPYGEEDIQELSLAAWLAANMFWLVVSAVIIFFLAVGIIAYVTLQEDDGYLESPPMPIRSTHRR